MYIIVHRTEVAGFLISFALLFHKEKLVSLFKHKFAIPVDLIQDKTNFVDFWRNTHFVLAFAVCSKRSAKAT